MAPNPDKIRSEAMKYLGKGDLGRALEAFQQLLQLTPNDIKVWVSVGDICHKLGNHGEAIRFYANAAKKYAIAGQLLQAISLNKSILEIDPTHKQTQLALAALYSKSAGAAANKASTPEKPVVQAKKIAASGGGIDLLPDDEPEVPPAKQKETLARKGAAEPPPADDDFFGDMGKFDAAEDDGATEASVSSLVANLPQFPIFSDLGADEFAAIIDELYALKFGPGDLIVGEGDPGESFYVICQGSARVVKKDTSGVPVELATLREGDFFGEFAYMTGTARTASVQAVGDIELLEFSRAALRKLEAQHPKITETIEQFYRKRLVGTVLKISPLFQPLSDAERNRLIREFKSIAANAGDVLIRQGQETSALFLIVAGRIHVTAEGDAGAASIAELKEGEFFGEIGLITGKVATATCTATVKSRLYKLEAERFQEVLQQFPTVTATLRDTAKQRVQALKSALAGGADKLAEAGLV